jgi:hypothetical protein
MKDTDGLAVVYQANSQMYQASAINIAVKNGVFWDATPYGSCKNRRFGGI